MPISEDFVWNLKMIVEAGGMDRLVQSLQEVARSASTAHTQLAAVGEAAREDRVSQSLPSETVLRSRGEAVDRLKTRISSLFEVQRQLGREFANVFQEIQVERPLRQIETFRQALEALQKEEKVTSESFGEFAHEFASIQSAAQRKAAQQIPGDATKDDKVKNARAQVQAQLELEGLLVKITQLISARAQSEQGTLRVIEQQQVAAARFNDVIEEGNIKYRTRQALLAAQIRGVGTTNTPSNEREELRRSLLAEHQRQQALRVGQTLQEIDALPEGQRVQARRDNANRLIREDKEAIARVDALILDLETKQVQQADRLRTSSASRAENLEVEAARLAQRATAHSAIPDLGAAVRVAEAEFQRRRGEIVRRFAESEKGISALPTNTPDRDEQLRINSEQRIVALKNAEIERDEEIEKATLAQNRALEQQRALITAISSGLQQRQALQEAHFERVAGRNFAEKPVSSLAAARNAAQLEFEAAQEQAHQTFNETQARINKIPTSDPAHAYLSQKNEQTHLEEIETARFLMNQKITEEQRQQAGLLGKEREAMVRLNEALLQRDAAARTSLNKFEPQRVAVSADAKLPAVFRTTLATVDSFQQGLSLRGLTRRFIPQQAVEPFSSNIETRLQQRLDTGRLQKALRQTQIDAEDRRLREEITSQPGSVPLHVKDAQVAALNASTATSLRAVSAEFTPVNQKIQFFNEEISRLSQESTRFRQGSFDLAILARTFFSAAGAGVTFLASGAEKLNELTIRLGAFNAIAKQTPEELAGTQEAVLQLFGNVPVKNLDDLGLALFNIQSSGFTAAESMKVLETSSKLATLGMTDTNSAAKFMIQTLKAFNLNTNESSLVASQLASILNTSVGEFQQVGQAIAKASSAFKLANQDLATEGGVFSVLTTAGGRSPRRGGEQSAAIARDIASPRVRQKIAEELHFDTVNAAGVTRPLEEIVQEFAKVGLSGGKLQDILNKIFTNSSVREGMLTLIQNSEKLNKDIDAARHPAEDFETVYARATDNVGSQFQILRNNMALFGVGAATALSPVLKDISALSHALGETALSAKEFTSGVAIGVITIGGVIGTLLAGASLAQRFRSGLTDAAVAVLNLNRQELIANSAEELRNKNLGTQNGLFIENTELLIANTLEIERNNAVRLGTTFNPPGGIPGAAGGAATIVGAAENGVGAGKQIAVEAEETATMSKRAILATGAINLLTKGIYGLTIAGAVAIVLIGVAEALKKVRNDEVDEQKKAIETYVSLKKATSLTTEQEIRLAEAREKLNSLGEPEQNLVRDPKKTAFDLYNLEQGQRGQSLTGKIVDFFTPKRIGTNDIPHILGGLVLGREAEFEIPSGKQGPVEIRQIARRFAQQYVDAQRTQNTEALQNLAQEREAFLSAAAKSDPKFRQLASETLTSEIDKFWEDVISGVGKVNARLGVQESDLQLRERVFREAPVGTFQKDLKVESGLKGAADALVQLAGKGHLTLNEELIKNPKSIDRLDALIASGGISSIKLDTREARDKAREAGVVLYDELRKEFAFYGSGGKIVSSPGFVSPSVGIPVDSFEKFVKGQQNAEAGNLPDPEQPFFRRQRDLQREANTQSQIQSIIGSATGEFGKQLAQLETQFLENQGRLVTQPRLQKEQTVDEINAQFFNSKQGENDEALKKKKLAEAERTFRAQSKAAEAELFNLEHTHQLALLDLLNQKYIANRKIADQIRIQTDELAVQRAQIQGFTASDKIRIINLQYQVDLDKLRAKAIQELLELNRQERLQGKDLTTPEMVLQAINGERTIRAQQENTEVLPGARTEANPPPRNTLGGAEPAPVTITEPALRTVAQAGATQVTPARPPLSPPVSLPQSVHDFSKAQQEALSRTGLPAGLLQLFARSFSDPRTTTPSHVESLGPDGKLTSSTTTVRTGLSPTLAGFQREILLRMPPEDRKLFELLVKASQAGRGATIPIHPPVPRTAPTHPAPVTPSVVPQQGTRPLSRRGPVPVLDLPDATAVQLAAPQVAARRAAGTHIAPPSGTHVSETTLPLAPAPGVAGEALERLGMRFGELGCAKFVSTALKAAGIPVSNASAVGLIGDLKRLGGQQVQTPRPGDVAFFAKGSPGFKDRDHVGIVADEGQGLEIVHNSSAAGRKLHDRQGPAVAAEPELVKQASFFVRPPGPLQIAASVGAGASQTGQIEGLIESFSESERALLGPLLDDLRVAVNPHDQKLAVLRDVAFGSENARLQRDRNLLETISEQIQNRAELVRSRSEAGLGAERALPRTERGALVFRETEAREQEQIDAQRIGAERDKIAALLKTSAALGVAHPRPGDVTSQILAAQGLPGQKVEAQLEEDSLLKEKTLADQKVRLARETTEKIFESRRDTVRFDVDTNNRFLENARGQSNALLFVNRLKGTGFAAERANAEEIAKLDQDKIANETAGIIQEHKLAEMLKGVVDEDRYRLDLQAQNNKSIEVEQQRRQKISDIRGRELAQELERQRLLIEISAQEQTNARLRVGLAGSISGELETALQRAAVARQILDLEAQRINLNKQANDAFELYNEEEAKNLKFKADQLGLQQESLTLQQRQAEISQGAERRGQQLDIGVRVGALSQDQANLFVVQNDALFRHGEESAEASANRQLEAIDKLRNGWIDHFQFLSDLYAVDRDERLKNLRATLVFHKEDAEASEQTRREINRLEVEDLQRLRSGLREVVGGGLRDLAVHPEQFNLQTLAKNFGAAIREGAFQRVLQRDILPHIGPAIDKIAGGVTGQEVPDAGKLREQAARQGEFIQQREQEVLARLLLSRGASTLLQAASGQLAAAERLQIAAAALSQSARLMFPSGGVEEPARPGARPLPLDFSILQDPPGLGPRATPMAEEGGDRKLGETSQSGFLQKVGGWFKNLFKSDVPPEINAIGDKAGYVPVMAQGHPQFLGPHASRFYESVDPRITAATVISHGIERETNKQPYWETRTKNGIVPVQGVMDNVLASSKINDALMAICNPDDRYVKIPKGELAIYGLGIATSDKPTRDAPYNLGWEHGIVLGGEGETLVYPRQVLQAATHAKSSELASIARDDKGKLRFGTDLANVPPEEVDRVSLPPNRLPAVHVRNTAQGQLFVTGDGKRYKTLEEATQAELQDLKLHGLPKTPLVSPALTHLDHLKGLPFSATPPARPAPPGDEHAGRHLGEPAGPGVTAKEDGGVTDRFQRTQIAALHEMGDLLKAGKPDEVARALVPLAGVMPFLKVGDARVPAPRTDPFNLHDPAYTKLSQDFVLPAKTAFDKILHPRVGDFTVGFGPGQLPDAQTRPHYILGGRQTAGQISTALAAFQAGTQAGPLGGAISGALTGAAFGPVGALVGGGLGLLGGLFKKKPPKQKDPFPALPDVEDVLFASKFFIRNAGEGGRQGLPITTSGTPADQSDHSVTVKIDNMTVVAPDPNKAARNVASDLNREIGALR